MERPWFEATPPAYDELRATLRRRYPTLHAEVADRKVRVVGTFALLGDADASDRYSIKVELPDDYPRSVPSVWETAGRIERVVERHVFPRTAALCVGVPVELWVRLASDFSIESYLEKAVRPYLIGNSLIEEGKPWPFDESAHGSKGVLEFYERYLGISDPAAVGHFLIAILQDRVRGHWNCPCGSGKAIRKCHVESVRALRAVPTVVLSDSIEHMIGLIDPQVAAFKAEKTKRGAA
jgi:hypothetical protein